MNKPKIFIGSTKERKKDAEDLQAIISEWSDPNIWTDNFTVGKSTIENLETKLPSFNMCVFLWTADDVANIRGKDMSVARDNLIFETGLSYAYIGRQNTVVVREENTKVISDLFGITDITHDFSQDIRILATKLRNHYDEISKTQQSKHSEKEKDETNNEIEDEGLNFEVADNELNLFGSSIRRKLEELMLDDKEEEFVDYLKKYVTKENAYIFPVDLYYIALSCISMGKYPHALQILEFANKRYPKDEDIVLKLIETYTWLDNPKNKVKAKKIMESFFCIEANANAMPIFTDKSKQMLAYSERLQKIFRVYLMDNEYDKLLSIIDSYEQLKMPAKNDMVINSYKAFAKWNKGDFKEALSLYETLVKKYPNEEDITNLGKMFFNTGEIEKGYQIYGDSY